MLVDIRKGNTIYSQVDSTSPGTYVAMGLTDADIEAAVEAQRQADAHAQRKAAYALESDPLYMEWQYDQTAEAEQAWRDKVAEIKARYPLPAEV